MNKKKMGSHSETMPMVALYNKQGNVKIKKSPSLRQVIGISRSDSTKLLKKKKEYIQQYYFEHPSNKMTPVAKATMEEILYFTPPYGTVAVLITPEDWSYFNNQDIVAELSDLPFIGAYMGDSDKRHLIVFAKTPTDGSNYNDHLGLFINELSKVGLSAHLMPLFGDTKVEIPYDPKAWVQIDWEQLETLTLPSNYCKARQAT